MNRHVLVAMLVSLLGILLPTSKPAARSTIADYGDDLAPLPTVPLVADAATIFSSSSRKKLFAVADNADELLPPDQAFTVSISANEANTLVAVFTPAKGYFLYRDKFVFRVQQPPSIKVADVAIPRGEMKDDPIFGKTEVFHEPVRVLVRLKRAGSSAGAVALYVRYQGCNEPLAVCYVPIEKNLHIVLPPTGAGR